jgi:Zn finger protein HypA/HybF involved in hydrogenase expression
MLTRKSIRFYLRGKNQACWCHLCNEHAAGKPLGIICSNCDPCHVDVLLEIANR